MKKTILVVSLFALFSIAGGYLLDHYCTDRVHKYEVEYAHGKWAMSDFTDSFTLSGNTIKYIDERGNEVIRYGTFSIRNNSNYKK